jgi:hypothetical protein
MKVILDQNEYNNNVTPIYFDGNDGVAIDGRTQYAFESGGQSGNLEINGDAFDVFLIIEDICLAKGKYEQIILADMHDLAVKKNILQEHQQGLPIKFDKSGIEELASLSFGSTRQLIRTLYWASNTVKHSRAVEDPKYGTYSKKPISSADIQELVEKFKLPWSDFM